VTCLALLASAIVLLSRTESAQAKKLSRLVKEKAEFDVLRAENQRLNGIQIDEAEITRLREENGDLLKLRNQLQQLHDELGTKAPEEPEVEGKLRAENAQLRDRIQETKQLPARAQCLRNLQLIDAAKNQLVEQKELLKGEPITIEDIAPFFPQGIPTCPDGGHYSVNRVGSPPACSIAGHSIP
jgi:hypothetical protein